MPLCEAGPAALIGVSHGGDANTRIAGGKVGIQLPAVAGAHDHEGDLAGHVDPLWLELVRQGRCWAIELHDGLELWDLDNDAARLSGPGHGWVLVSGPIWRFSLRPRACRPSCITSSWCDRASGGRPSQ